MEDLQRMAENLPSLGDLVQAPMDHVIEYMTQGGQTQARGLLKIPQVGVLALHMEKGAAFPEHSHPEREWVIVYEGRLKMNVDGEVRVLCRGDYSFLNCGQKHFGTALEETRTIAVTIPCDEGYPDAAAR